MKSAQAPKRTRKSYPLRMPPAMHTKLAALAVREQRTLNAQIIHVLERWLEQQSPR